MQCIYILVNAKEFAIRLSYCCISVTMIQSCKWCELGFIWNFSLHTTRDIWHGQKYVNLWIEWLILRRIFVPKRHHLKWNENLCPLRQNVESYVFFSPVTGILHWNFSELSRTQWPVKFVKREMYHLTFVLHWEKFSSYLCGSVGYMLSLIFVIQWEKYIRWHLWFTGRNVSSYLCGSVGCMLPLIFVVQWKKYTRRQLWFTGRIIPADLCRLLQAIYQLIFEAYWEKCTGWIPWFTGRNAIADFYDLLEDIHQLTFVIYLRNASVDLCDLLSEMYQLPFVIYRKKCPYWPLWLTARNVPTALCDLQEKMPLLTFVVYC